MGQTDKHNPQQPPVTAPVLSEVIFNDKDKAIGVVVGHGWIANDVTVEGAQPLMRPVVLIHLANGAVVAYPAELARAHKIVTDI